jgi:NADH:quinone reductase (non-electrogenic)
MVDGRVEHLPYNKLILAAGSALWRSSIPGVAEHAFDVDTYAGASRLQRHLASLGAARPTVVGPAGRWTAVVIGAGLVGIEIACELHERLDRARRAAGPAGSGEAVRVLLLAHGPEVGARMGAAALPAIRAALAAAGVEARPQIAARSVDPEGIGLEGGGRVTAATTICATGMRASPLAGALPAAVGRDHLGRVPVDAFLRVEGAPDIYAAGDVARATADAAGHTTVMSCQHARPMGRFAGHNAACDVVGREGERLAFAAPDYVTVLDLGRWGAVYTAGWDRATVVAAGPKAKEVKREINTRRIYPPEDGERRAILDAAAPVVQRAPAVPA